MCWDGLNRFDPQACSKLLSFSSVVWQVDIMLLLHSSAQIPHNVSQCDIIPPQITIHAVWM